MRRILLLLSNDPRVPTAVRDELNQWGLARDEFVGNENWPSQLNVSGTRRMVGERVLTERHLFRLRKLKNPLALVLTLSAQIMYKDISLLERMVIFLF